MKSHGSGTAWAPNSDMNRTRRGSARASRFMSEFGAQAVPEPCDFIDAEAWPDLDWERLEVHHGLQKWVFDERVPPSEFDSFEAWSRATQVYQAELLRHHIELLRRLKYRPAGGFCLFSFNDPAPVVSWSLLDHERRPKLAWDAVRAACRPLAVIADRPPAIVVPGDPVELDIHVVNDLREPVDGAVVDVSATWPGGRQRWRFGGTVDADDVVRVGTIELEVPETLGALSIELTLTAGDQRVDNRYTSAITVPPLRPGV